MWAPARSVRQSAVGIHKKEVEGKKKNSLRRDKQSCSYLPLAGDHGVCLKMHSVVSYISRSCYALVFFLCPLDNLLFLWSLFFLMYSCKTVLFLYFLLPGIRSQCYSLIAFSHPPPLLPCHHRFTDSTTHMQLPDRLCSFLLCLPLRSQSGFSFLKQHSRASPWL